MRKINFTKMTASGNDFVVTNSLQIKAYNLKPGVLAKNLCDKKLGIGADGLLVLGKSKRANIRMRIYNLDGSEAQMCGNGARCAALFVAKLPSCQISGLRKIKIETKAGIIDSEIKGGNVRVKLTDPRGLKLGIPVNLNGRALRVNFIDTGVPHAVIFVNGLEKIDVERIGRQIRFHKKFSPKGANVDFVEVLSDNLISVRTYERGVEGETLACGTGSVASALISVACCLLPVSGCVNVKTQGKEVLKVYFDKCKGAFKNVWLQGRAKIVYSGNLQIK